MHIGRLNRSDTVKYNYPESISNIVEPVCLKMVIFPTCFEYLGVLG